MSDDACRACQDRMPELAVAAPGDDTAAHLSGCAECREELGQWQVIAAATAVATDVGPKPSSDVLGAVWNRLGHDVNAVVVDPGSREVTAVAGETSATGVRPAMRHALQLLRGQLPLIQRRLWAASAVVMAVGAVFSMTAVAPSVSAGVFGMVAPAVAAVGLALVYGPEVDPGLELALATPTSPRSVLLARMTLVLGYDVALALTANAVVTVIRDDVAWWGLIAQWLGPMLLLSSLALLASVIFRPATAITAALTLWTVRLVTLTDAGRAMADGAVESLVTTLWSTGPTTLVTSVALLAAATVLAGRRQQWA